MCGKEKNWDEDKVIAEAAEIAARTKEGFDVKNFKRIKVLDRDGQPFVSFQMPVCYIPWMSEAYYSIGVMPAERFTTCQSLANPEDQRTRLGKAVFFQPSEESEKAVDLVFKAINDSEEVGDMDKDDIPEDTVVKIYSTPTTYRVVVESYGIVSEYHVDKQTGGISGGGHEHLVLPDDEE